MPYHLRRAVNPAWLPPALLAAYAVAFGGRALGGGLLVFDDHPGQLYRLVHAITVGLAPWRLNPGWWAGYAELQYYPPGFAWLGAVLHHAALGAIPPASVYQALLWLTWLLPGATTYLLLRRLLGDPWLALPGALVGLTLSAGCRSGVEEGLRWGLVAARLGWGVLPLLAWTLLPWLEGTARAPLAAAGLVAAITLLHPAHAPAAAAMVLLAAGLAEPRGRRLIQACSLLALGVGLTSVWLVPLVVHLGMALPLAWQDATPTALAWRVLSQPVLIALALVGLAGGRLGSRERGPRARWVLVLVPVMAGLVALGALAAGLGVAWLPADRLMDGLHLSLVVAGGMGFGVIASRFARPMVAAAVGVALLVPLSWGPQEPGLSLWPGDRQWPKEAEVVRGLRVDALWEAIRDAPPGRVLFLRSAAPLDWRPEWWRPHTHITALTPLRAGRAMLGGTFTHPSPVAGFFYTGSAANRPLTLLAEQRDGHTLFGRAIADLDPAAFNRLAERLAVSAVVAFQDDAGRTPFLAENPIFGRRSRIGPFTLLVAARPGREPTAVGPQRWRLDVPGQPAGWLPVPIAFSPLWTVEVGGTRLAIRPDERGLLEVDLPPGTAVIEIAHRPGLAEWTGLGISLLGLAGLALAALGRARA